MKPVRICSRQGSQWVSLLAVAVGLMVPAFAAESVSDGSAVQSRALPSRAPLAAGESLFRAWDASATGVEFQMQLPDLVKHDHELLHLSVMGGVAAGDVDGDGLPDVYLTSPQGGNRLYRNLGGFRFEDITERAGLMDTEFWGTGAVMVDIDGDGDLDIHASGYRHANRLWINEGGETGGVPSFRNQAAAFGLDYNGASMNAAFADYDRDGDLDMYLTTTAVPPPAGTEFRVEFQDGRPLIPEHLREYWALIYLPGEKVHRTEAGQFDRFYRNDGGKFVDISGLVGIDGAYFTLGAVWWDFDGDGWPDLYVSNDYLGPDQLYLNQRDGTFREIIREAVPHTPWSSMGLDVGDLNNDGRLDLITTDMLGTTHYRRNVMQGEISRTGWFLDVPEPRQYSRNTVLINSGTPRMLEAGYLSGMVATDWTWAPMIEDFDEDGRVDVYFSNGMLRDVQHADYGNYADKVLGGGTRQWAEFWAEQDLLRERNHAYHNLGDLEFQETSAQWGLDRLGVSFGMAAADFDGDGDTDLVVNNVDAPASLYENRTTSGNRIRLRLLGADANTFGLGATVRIKTTRGSQVRYLTSARGWLSSSEPVVHFGLGDQEVESVTVLWPDGVRQELGALAVNQVHEVRARNLETDPVMDSREPIDGLFRPSERLGGVRDELSTHDDAIVQPLLPYHFSRARYCMAWGDVNGDERPDLFLGGGVGQPGRLFLNEGEEGFTPREVAAFGSADLHADVDAVFFDHDGDGDLDLFVVSGGIEVPASAEALFQSRLYLNDGVGAFSEAGSEVLPRLTTAGSCVAVGDVNGDGRDDLFIGGGMVTGRYPLAGPSRLLLSEGDKLRQAALPEGMSAPGLVTAASLTDINGDDRVDLIVAVDWGTIRVFENQGEEWVETTAEYGLSSRTGWWRSLAVADIDGDGDVDIVAGNLGRNTRYAPTMDSPERLYLGAFGDGGAELLVEAYLEGGALFPRRGYDQLSRLNPSLRDKFLNFHEFSRADLPQIFGATALSAAETYAVNTAESAVWLNDGHQRFEFLALPVMAQLSCVNDIAVIDYDRDGRSDLVLAQNDFTPDKLTGRIDGGVSLLLRGTGDGGFEAVSPQRSGIVVPGEARRVEAVDVDGDGQRDLAFGVPGAAVRAFMKAAE